MMRRSAEPWASARTRDSRTGTTASSEPCKIRTGRGAIDRMAPTALTSRIWRAHGSNGDGNERELMMVVSRAYSSNRRGCVAQSSKSACAPIAATPRISVSMAAAQSAIEPPLPKPPAQTSRTSGMARRNAQAASMSSRQPCMEKFPSESPHPRKVNTMAIQPISVAMRSASSGNERAESRPPWFTSGKP